MLTVWAVCVGTKYSAGDVYMLRDMVARNLSMPYQFRCLTDRVMPFVDCFIPAETWPGWFSKLLLFKYSMGPSLYLDLDSVVAGPLDGLVSTRLSMPANWGQSGHGGCQSSVMSWCGDYSGLLDNFDPSKIDANGLTYEGCWGDQEYITREFGNPGGAFINAMRGVLSYKYHCQNGLPEGAKVVCFHGEPKPSQVSDAWVAALRFIPTHH